MLRLPALVAELSLAGAQLAGRARWAICSSTGSLSLAGACRRLSSSLRSSLAASRAGFSVMRCAQPPAVEIGGVGAVGSGSDTWFAERLL